MLPTSDFSFSSSLQDAFSTLLNYIPKFIGSLIILLVGWFIAKARGKLITKLLEKINFDQTMDRANVTQYLARSGTNLTPSSLLGKVVFWFDLIITLTLFTSALGVPQISGFFNQMLAYIPNVFAATLIIFIAMLVGKFAAGIVRGVTGSEPLAKATGAVILVYAGFMALVQLHVAQQLTGPTFLIILAGISLALGLAFGLGGRNQAKSMIEKFANSNPVANRPQGQAGATAGGGQPGTQGGYQQPGGGTPPGTNG